MINRRSEEKRAQETKDKSVLDFGQVVLRRAALSEAHLKGANFIGVHLERANLARATGITRAQIDEAFGDAVTELPADVTRPAHWAEREGEGATPAA